ncbi:repetitive surface protein Esp [Enterococcus faecium]|uniref:repetitive surface protein Esp n=1 Tax=Enterococcus faecium TaxID=1352 RepID=UPI0015FB5BC0|nr:repetitive surface protein Esp [Enterococcus faecium]QMX43548.1 repetitive surface protein Esp [Enterococcus faecium]QMX52163.1 repetitive surface protein Esp [Enterococcus faecium]QMX57846.1 repetitive surface protein Esp [Enterococcus faecium]
MVSKNNKRVFLEKTKKRVLKYSIKKLSVGVASVLIGVGLVLGTTELVKAQDEISPSSPLETAISSVQVGDKVASGNTFQENPGYTKNYNFSDLQFSPQELTGDTLKGNTIGFEVYGKHNIAASTKNWEIRLQLDERLAKYVEKIQVDPKKGIGSSRRTFVRINDSLGRPTNIWKVNYIRASDGLFAGAETTDTQTAPNGVITFEKSLDEIFKEIGIDNLKTDRLMYRIYLVSHQDDDKIVPGIDSTGYFLTDSDDFYNSLDVSENNPDQFKHGSVSAKYEKPNTQTKDGSGSTGANGAIILDHKLTKNYNFSYSSSAKGTPWYANYKIDERLVPYVAGIQMHMVQADKVTYDVSFESGTKVADLAIERREGHENYGIGSITNNDLTKLIDFANASPRPVVIRYVLQLTKPLDEILEDMKATAQVEENKPFGEDFIFDSWLSDTNKKLIQNTYGTGYYYLQDIDGDGNPDDKEESGDTNPYIGKPELEEVYDVDTTVKGKVFIHELAGTGHKAQLVDKEGTVLAEKTIAPNEKDGAPISDTVEFEFTGVDSSKLIAKDELKIQIVSPGFDKPEEGSTVIKESPKAVDKQTVVVGFKPDAKESIRNNKNLPEDAEYSWKTEPDTSNVTDSTKGIVTVKIGNRTFDVDVEFAVKASQAMENDATYVPITTTPETTVQSGKPTFDKPDVPLAKDAFSISDVYNKYFGNASVDANTGIVTFTPAKGVGESEPITGTIPIKIVYQDGSVGTTDLAVTVSKDIYENPGENIPAGYHKVTFTAGEGTSIESGTTVFAVKDGVSLPEDKLPVLKAKDGYTDAKWPEEATQPITADDTEFVSSATKLDDIIENPGENIPAGYHKVTFTAGEGTSIESGTTVFAVKDGVSLPEDKLPVLKAKDGYTDAKWPEEATQPITADDTEFVSSATKLDDIIENPGENIPAGYHKVTFTAGEGTSIESGTTVFAVKDGVSLPEDKLPVLKAKDGYTDAKWPEEATQPITADDTEFVSSATKLDDIIENPGENIPAGYHKVTFTAGEGTSIESGTTVFAVKDGVSLPEDKLPVLKAKDGYTDAKWPEEATQPITADDTEFVSSATKLDDKSDADKYNPEGQKVTTELNKEPDAFEGIKNKEDLPKDTKYTWKEKVDVSAAGNKKGTVVVTYPDGSSDEVEVDVTVTDNRSDADKYEPTVEGEKVEVGGTVDLTDNVTNLPTLPEGTTVTDVTPGGTIDTNTPGNYEGVIEVTYPDGTKDTVKVPVEVTDNRSDADKYEPTVEGEKVEVGGTVDLTDNVTNLPTLPEGTTVTDVTPGGTIDTNTPGNYEGVIEVTYPDGTKDTVKVPVEVTDNRSDADKYTPMVEGEKVEVGGTVDLTDNVTNLPTLPEGTTVTDVTPGGTIDTNTPGNYEGVIEVTYPDGTKDTVKVPVEVTDNRSDADKYEPTVEGEKVEVGGTVDLTDNVTNLPTLPEGTTVTDVTPGGTIDTNTPGNYEGVIEVTYPDGTKDTVKVPVEVTDNRSDADKYTPMVEGEKVEVGGTVDLTDNVTNLPTLPEGTTVTDVTPGGTIDTNTPGNYEGVIEVTYPDGTKDTVKVPVEVTDNRSDADKYTPMVEGEKVEVGGTVDLTDNVTNLPTLPEGTTVTDVTPGGTIDTNTPGNYEGVIEVTYPDGTKDTVKVPVEVTDNRSDADKYEPTVEGEKVEVGGTVDLTDNVTNLPALPEGTTVTDVTPGGTIDTNTPGNYEGVIEVTYPDGTKDTVKVPVEVTDNRSDADKYEPTVEGEKVEIGGTVDLTDNVTNLPALPEGTTVTDVTPGGTIDTNTPGNYEGVIEVTYPDGTKDTVKVPVEVTDNRSNADKYNPEGQKVTTDLNKEPDASEGIKNKEDLPKGTTYAWKEKVDVSTAGNKKGTIVVTYPDGSSDEVEVDVTVTDTRSDADKYNPEGQKVTTDLNKEPDASEGIKNKEDLPKGTTYTWKEKVDVSTAGNKKGTVVVTYPDGSKEEVEVTISVVDKKAPNKPQVDPITEGDQIVTGKTEPNAEVTVTLPDGSQHHGTADKNGNFTVKVPKLEAGTKVIVTATDESGNTSEPTNVVVSSNKKDSGKNGSKGSKTDNQGSNSNQDKNRGKSQSSKVFPKTGESDSNIFTISGGLILLGTLGLLGYKNRKKENE